jgi:DNA-binding CsgD family transcriptional regulator
MDERTLLDVIDRAYAAALEPDGWQAFVDRLSTAYGGLAAVYMQDTATLAGEISVFAGTDLSYARSFEDYYCFKSSWYRKQRRPGELIVSDVSESELMLNSEYNADWLRPQGLSSSITTPAMVRGSSVLNVSVLRGQSRLGFTEAELEAWRRLTPHVLRALEVRRTMQASLIERNSALLALNDLDVGVAFASAEGRLLLANPAAETVLSAGQALRVVGGRLHADGSAATNQLHRLIAEASRSGSGGAAGGTLVVNGHDGAAIAVMVSPVPASNGTLPLEPMAMLLMTDRRRAAQVDSKALERVYGLTPAQAQLLQALIQGRRLGEYAGDAGLSINTVKSHMKQIFEKTGENRQADLVRRVLADPLLKRA